MEQGAGSKYEGRCFYVVMNPWIGERHASACRYKNAVPCRSCWKLPESIADRKLVRKKNQNTSAVMFLSDEFFCQIRRSSAIDRSSKIWLTPLQTLSVRRRAWPSGERDSRFLAPVRDKPKEPHVQLLKMRGQWGTPLNREPTACTNEFRGIQLDA